MKYIYYIIALGIVCACKQKSKVSVQVAQEEHTAIPEPVQQIDSLLHNNLVYTVEEITNNNGKSVRIENSFPKGGLSYTDTYGKTYIYAIFYTKITNTTATPFSFNIGFNKEEMYRLEHAFDTYFTVVLPNEEMHPNKESLFNYGLKHTNAILEEASYTKQQLIKPNQSNWFYVAVLFNKPIDGTFRAGFHLNNGKVYYQVNGTEIACGTYHF